jgi:pimeloyl-ACP methyl ester carboxylesterase/predicted glycosyltransferase
MNPQPASPVLEAWPHDQMRARDADETGFVERDGVRIFWESYGSGEPTILLLPTWSIIHSRVWKGQIPYLSRHCRVVTFDGRGNGRSDRPAGAASYAVDEFAADALAVMDATGTASAALVGESCGALWGTVLAADFPERVDSIVYISPAVALAPEHPERASYSFDEDYSPEAGGWALYNRHAWLRDYPRFLDFFFAQCFNEPHSTKPIDDAIAWASETTPEVMIDTILGLNQPRAEPFAETCARVQCRTVVIHGDQDLIRPHAQGKALAAATGGRMLTLAGSGHLPEARDPVRVNLLLREQFCPPGPPRRWTRGLARPRRALYVSSPIGLGHVRRDLAIARELRRLVPDLQIDWLAQDPVTRVLADAGERIHPASVELASESAHFQAEAGDGHELSCFSAMRRMDEILVANFMVFHDVVREEQYDVWIGDEAWDVDHHLHENPELKTAPYAWLTDFVGYLPMSEGGDREAALTSDYNAEMIEQIDRHPRVRDRSIFVGDPEDIVPGAFGPGLPGIGDWTEEHFRFSGYITGFDPAEVADRGQLRARLGYRDDERVCVVAVGGSGIGSALLRRVIDSFPAAQRLVPKLRMIVVTGPRIDPRTFADHAGLEIRSYVPELYRHLAACDLAVVQGGLTTTMELTANGRPFLYFPLKRHFEQCIHVRHRLERYRAGRRMDFDDSPPEAIAEAISQEICRTVDYRPVATDGAIRAAQMLAELLGADP